MSWVVLLMHLYAPCICHRMLFLLQTLQILVQIAVLNNVFFTVEG
jgi:hypothetical protein